MNWLNREVDANGAPPAWLRTTSIRKGGDRAVRVETPADVTVVDRPPGRREESVDADAAVAGGVEEEEEAVQVPSGAIGMRVGDGPLGVRVIRMSRGGGGGSGSGGAAQAEESGEGGADPANTMAATDTVRLVIVSDTHGYERSLTDDDKGEDGGAGGAKTRLPEGDIIIHCGDYQVDEQREKRLAATSTFDEWLADQPSSSGLKLICRGNHDHLNADFPKSRATYVVRPAVYKVCGLTIAVVPFSRGRLREPLPECDVLVTHVPPKGILDRCYNGDRAGSRFLKEAVCASLSKPRLWLCGHIHEGYGFEVVRFGSDASQATLVVNAANANTGRANKLEHAPIVVEIQPSQPWRRPPSSSSSQADGHSVEPQQHEASAVVVHAGLRPSSGDDGVPVSERRLLAVDLGLRTGLALYDGEGMLLRYAQFPKLDDAVALGELAERWLAGEMEGEEGEEEGEEEAQVQQQQKPVTHLAVEGRDVVLREEWDAAAIRVARRRKEEEAQSDDSDEPPPQLRVARSVDVSPEAWRKELLTQKERKTGSSSKAAARLIARQLVSMRGAAGKAHAGRFPTDAAEAVLIGYYAVRRLGWCGADGDGPAVKRYTNGAVVL